MSNNERQTPLHMRITRTHTIFPLCLVPLSRQPHVRGKAFASPPDIVVICRDLDVRMTKGRSVHTVCRCLESRELVQWSLMTPSAIGNTGPLTNVKSGSNTGKALFVHHSVPGQKQVSMMGAKDRGRRPSHAKTQTHITEKVGHILKCFLRQLDEKAHERLRQGQLKCYFQKAFPVSCKQFVNGSNPGERQKTKT
jgi:hypothetical protein